MTLLYRTDKGESGYLRSKEDDPQGDGSWTLVDTTLDHLARVLLALHIADRGNLNVALARLKSELRVRPEAALVNEALVETWDTEDGLLCSACRHTVTEAHSWKDCAEVLLKWKESQAQELAELDEEIARLKARGARTRRTISEACGDD